MSAILTYLVLVCAHTVWTVDAGGSGNFTTIQAAIDAAATDDVILVQPGSYEEFRLAKSLVILGPAGGPAPIVTGTSVVLQADHVALAGLDLDRLLVREVGGWFLGRGLSAGVGTTLQEDAALVLADTHAALVTHGKVHGFSGADGLDAVQVSSCSATFVRLDLLGGAGQDCISFNGTGGMAARLLAEAAVRFEECTLQGGNGSAPFLCSCLGLPGSGVRTFPPSLGLLVGGPGDVCMAGVGPSFCGGSPGYPILAETGADVFASGITIGPGPVAGPVHVLPDERPHLSLQGSDALGAAMQLDLAGPAGASGQILAGTLPASLTLPGWDGELAVDPAALLATVPVILDSATGTASFRFTLPTDPSVIGRILVVQAAFPGVPGVVDPSKKFFTGADAVIIAP